MGEARKRLGDAREFLDAAELYEDGPAQVAVSNAVLAGIAASDAACCAILKRRSRSSDHRDASLLLEKITGGREIAKEFTRLISLKDKGQYGMADVPASDARAAVRQARRLVEFAEGLVS